MTVIERSFFIFSFLTTLTACQWIGQQSKKEEPNNTYGHLQPPLKNQSTGAIPKLLQTSPTVPLPTPQAIEPTHTVIVNNVPVAELLFSLARDADINLDIDEDVGGFITLNAINQPLNAILDRICKSSNLIYEKQNNVLRISRDKPVLRSYRVDYINLSRNAQSQVSVATQINSTGQGAGASTGGGGRGNNSSTEVTNTSTHEFWKTLQSNIAAIIHESTPPAPLAAPDSTQQTSNPLAGVIGAITDSTASSSAAPTPALNTAAIFGNGENNPDIILNRESGILGVRTTAKKHQEVERFLNEILFSTHRQVLIEATIAEVTLNDSYQAGIDWNILGDMAGDSFSIGQELTDIALFKRPAFTFTLDQQKSNGDSIQSTLSALESFGDVTIMSSPKVMALNNQTALLKVVDNLVYFTVEVSIEASSSSDGNSTPGLITYETEINTVPVGFVMSVTPYISENDSVTLNVRPTISRVIRQARDPNPALAEVGVISEIPVIQVREVESILKVSSGDIAVMGGLMQDETSKNRRGIPLLSRIPWLGSLFRYDDNTIQKTELVIFIRPIVIKHASLSADLQSYSAFLPKGSQ